MSEFPTEQAIKAVEHISCVWIDCPGPHDLRRHGPDGPRIARAKAEKVLAALAPLIRAREAAAWDEGADAAWQRSTPEVNGLHYHWRSSGEPLNPHVRQEADQ